MPSPVVGDEVILACEPKGDPVYAISAGGNGNISDKGLAWKSSDLCTPAYYQGYFYVLHDKKQHLTRIEFETGNTIW